MRLGITLCMAKLLAQIDTLSKCIRFSGPGTFSSKELIKSLGVAKWNAIDKSWVVSVSDISKEKLFSMFEDIEISQAEQAKSSDDVDNNLQVDEQVFCEENINFSPSEKKEIIPAPNIVSNISVSQLLAKISNVLFSSFLNTLYVRGVLSSVKHYSGRVYLDLCDSEDNSNRVSCVIWNDVERICFDLNKAGFSLEPNLPVLFEVQVGLSKKDARISLSVVSIVAEYTLAKLAAERDKTNERLIKEGLFDRNRSTILPFLPKRLGILTSKGGTVINDFRASLDVAQFDFELIWLSVAVQGDFAVSEVVDGIKQLGKAKALDAILLFRGGGSAAELSIFNNYGVAKAICECPIPVISAIGHERDESSVQDVSFLHFGVPKDIGRFFADKVLKFRDDFKRMAKDIVIASKNSHGLASQRTEATLMHISQNMSNVLNVKQEVFGRTVIGLSSMMNLFVAQRMQRLVDISKPISAMALKLRVDTLSNLQLEFRRMSQFITSSVSAAFLRLDGLSAATLQLVMNLHERVEDKTLHLEQIINSSSPEHQLKRGFTLIKRCDASGYVTSGRVLNSLDEIEIEFFDATQKAQIK